MPKARKHQISLDATPYYHCVSRCVRRAFLCGEDKLTGKSYEHRRAWIEERIHTLANAFCIDVCAYAVMSNHIHLVLHINAAQAANLTTLDICQRWHAVFKGTPLTQRFCAGDRMSKVEVDAIVERAEIWREQIHSISWFMRCLNEPIARQANSEDGCTGSFWESRFACQTLLDEQALAACMAYVDLNPIRANMAKTPETSEHTSIKVRVEKLNKQQQPSSLFPFVGNPRANMPQGLPFELSDYISLVDWTGRQIKPNKRGAIATNLPDILKRINIPATTWLLLARQFENKVSMLVGDASSIREKARYFGYRRTPNQTTLHALSA